MPSRLTKPRPESKLKPNAPRSSRDYPISEQETGLLHSLRHSSSSAAPSTSSSPALSSDRPSVLLPAGGSSAGTASTLPPKTSAPAKQGRLSGFLHGRKHSKPALSPATLQDTEATATSTRATSVTTETPATKAPSPPPSRRQQNPVPEPRRPGRMASIRAVGRGSLDEEHHGGGGTTTEEESSCESSLQSQSASRSSAFSSSVNSNASGRSAVSTHQQPHQLPKEYSAAPAARLKTSGGGDGLLEEQQSNQTQSPSAQSSLRVPGSGGISSPMQKRHSAETGRLSFDSRTSSFEIPTRESSRLAATAMPLSPLNSNSVKQNSSPFPAPPSESNHSSTDLTDVTITPAIATAAGSSPNGGSGAGPGWDSSVGKAGLGKTGRVINKLVSENEALKRDIKIEKLKADEARQKSLLLEDKMERLAGEYEGRLLEANVTKALLARKERQVESLQATVEAERAKATAALDRERVWKDEMERAKAEAKREVEEARGLAAMMEGRYNAIAGHWGQQGEQVQKVVGSVREEVERLVEERRGDDERISTLREVCDQQDGNIRELTRQKEELTRRFEEYKRVQEEGLKDIKRKAEQREREQEMIIEESREVLNKLRWALRVKENVKWAE